MSQISIGVDQDILGYKVRPENEIKQQLMAAHLFLMLKTTPGKGISQEEFKEIAEAFSPEQRRVIDVMIGAATVETFDWIFDQPGCESNDSFMGKISELRFKLEEGARSAISLFAPNLLPKKEPPPKLEAA